MFNIGRNGTDAVGFAPKIAAKKSKNVGAIVGGTVGGVVGALLAGLAVFFYVRSRRDRAHLKDTVAEFEEHKVASTIQPFPLGPGAHDDSPGVHARLLPEDDVAPPAYEESEVAPASTVGSGGPVRVSKSEYVQSTASGSVVPDEEGAGASGSSQPPRIEPNRMYNIEE